MERARRYVKTAVVILAAGASSRMGNAKLLMPFCGSTLLNRACGTACEVNDADAIVITGAYHLAMEPVLCGIPLRAVYNQAWASGQASSVGLAARTCRELGYRAMVVFTADAPFVTRAHIDGLIDMLTNSGFDAVAVEHEGRMGNPCIFRDTCYAALVGLEGDEGARRILRSPDAYGLKVGFLPVDDERVFEDVDTPEDFDRVELLVRKGMMADAE